MLNSLNWLKKLSEGSGSKSSLTLLTQKGYWHKNMNDESVHSSLQFDHIVFHENNTERSRKILRVRAEEGLNEYDNESRASCLRCLLGITGVKLGSE